MDLLWFPEIETNREHTRTKQKESVRMGDEKARAASEKNRAPKKKKHYILIFNIELYLSYSTVLTMYIYKWSISGRITKAELLFEIISNAMKSHIVHCHRHVFNAIWNEMKSNKLLLVWPWIFCCCFCWRRHLNSIPIV